VSNRPSPPPVRLARPDDEAGIIELLRLSLGEESTEKNVAFWRWKHVENPFGPSPVLVAEKDGRLVGVRAFMQWEWLGEGRSFRALRAVDTATHPDYRGRGIFKVLTLELLERCREEGYDFIFNTPNEQSRPGYLKMGWRTVGKLPVRLAPLRPGQVLATKVFGRPVCVPTAAEQPHQPELLNEGEDHEWLRTVPGPKWRTPPTAEFLKWRYLDCPAREYRLIGKPGDFIVFYYLRAQSFGTELRLVHYLCRPGATDAMKAAINRLRRGLSPTVISAAPGAGLPAYFLPGLPVGLILTYRALNHPAPPPLRDWAYALGDMELF
jgi:GNAT superfamily N-acetyltransferase